MVIIERSRIDELDICTVPKVANGHSTDSCGAEPRIQTLAATGVAETVRCEKNFRSECSAALNCSVHTVSRRLKYDPAIFGPSAIGNTSLSRCGSRNSPTESVAPSNTSAEGLASDSGSCVTQPHALETF